MPVPVSNSKIKKQKIICSDLIFRHLAIFRPELGHAVLHDEKGMLGDLDFHVNGFVSPKDLQRIAKVHSPELFNLNLLYDGEDD